MSDKKIKIEVIKKEHLEEAKKQAKQKLIDEEVEVARTEYIHCTKMVAAFDKDIKKLEDKKQEYVDRLKKFD